MKYTELLERSYNTSDVVSKLRVVKANVVEPK